MKTRLWKFVDLARDAPWLPALFERVILRQKTVFLGPLKSLKNMLRKSTLIGLFVLTNNRRTKISSGRVGKAIVLTCFFTAGYGRHGKLGLGFRMAGYGRHGSQWVNVRQFPICHGPPDVSEIMQQPKIFSIYFLTMPKFSGLLLCMLVQKRIIHWQLELKFQLISSWTCSLESMNFLSWQCTGILMSLSHRLQENNPKALVHDPGKIFATCRPDHRRPKWSPLQSLPACNTLEAEVCLSVHSQ